MNATLPDLHHHDAASRVVLYTIELRIGTGFLAGERIAWVFINGEPVDGYSHTRSWAKARKLAMRAASNAWQVARSRGLSAHPNTRPQWRRGWEAL